MKHAHRTCSTLWEAVPHFWDAVPHFWDAVPQIAELFHKKWNCSTLCRSSWILSYLPQSYYSTLFLVGKWDDLNMGKWDDINIDFWRYNLWIFHAANSSPGTSHPLIVPMRVCSTFSFQRFNRCTRTDNIAIYWPPRDQPIMCTHKLQYMVTTHTPTTWFPCESVQKHVIALLYCTRQ